MAVLPSCVLMLYGIVGRADLQATVERIYRTKERTPSKSPIILIGDVLQLFDTYDTEALDALSEYWPGPNSIILPSTAAPTWIARDNASVAYRLPADESLRTLLQTIGPLIAPSANPEGLAPAATIDEAHAYFGDQVDYYEDGGAVLLANPSSLFRYTDGAFVQLR